MIETTNIRTVNHLNYDEVWAIVRSLKIRESWMKQVSELSPSLELFYDYRRWAAQGSWNKETFEKLYVPRFEKEIAENQIAQNKLHDLIQLHLEGKKIALVCFCENKELCHRKLIAEMLTRRGIDVIFN